MLAADRSGEEVLILSGETQGPKRERFQEGIGLDEPDSVFRRLVEPSQGDQRLQAGSGI